MAKIEGITGGLQSSGNANGERGALDGENVTNAGRRGAGGSGSTGAALGAGGGGIKGKLTTAREGRREHDTRDGQDGDGSIEGLRGSLKLSLELVTTGEKHASANTTVMADMSEWLLNLEQKQLVRHRRDNLTHITLHRFERSHFMSGGEAQLSSTHHI